MPRLTVWFLRSSLVYLAVGFTAGTLILVHKGTAAIPWAWQLLPLHIAALFVGWMTQLAMGVAFWILPRFGFRRGNVPLAWTAWALVNVGLAGTLVAAVLALPPWSLAVAYGAMGLGAVAFGVHAWPRVKPALPAAEREAAQ